MNKYSKQKLNARNKKIQPTKETDQRNICLVHFLRLLAARWPGAQSARDNHVLACYCEIFTERNGNKPFSIRSLTNPPCTMHCFELGARDGADGQTDL